MHTMPKLKTDIPEKTKNSWNPWCQSGGWKGTRRRTMVEKFCGEYEISAWNQM